MQTESTNETGGETPAVPMAWFCAEYIADEMLRGSALVDGGSLEYRAGRETLALTVHLCDGSGEFAGTHAVASIEEWLNRTAYGYPWPEWVERRLAAREERAGALGSGPAPDLLLARESWQWLSRTELLTTDLGDDSTHRRTAGRAGTVDEQTRVWTPAWQLGLPLGHLAIHLF
ncbi:hypothetical protein ACIQ9E_07435 [Streptomyces sp. NPDC094448]|uniref:hypothetical protein n=1 Tax=Streptomyces sp. NPDC094448 TaxID=3366063 RepID=UPI003819313E